MINKNKTEKFLTLTISLILVVTIILSQGCKVADPELEKNKQLWHEKKTTDYDFVCEQFGGPMYGFVPMLIKVRDGKVISMEPTRERGQLERIDGYEDFDTVEKMFDEIQQAYNKSHFVRITYNKDLGFPEDIIIDSMKSSDSGERVVISRFEVIKTN